MWTGPREPLCAGPWLGHGPTFIHASETKGGIVLQCPAPMRNQYLQPVLFQRATCHLVARHGTRSPPSKKRGRAHTLWTALIVPRNEHFQSLVFCRATSSAPVALGHGPVFSLH